MDIFSTNKKEFAPFYSLIKQSLSAYPYIESILVAFDGYEHFKAYDYIIRSDLDTFLTPLFGTWLPKNCKFFLKK